MKTLSLLLLTAILVAPTFCQAQAGTGYQVVGNVQGLPDGSRVYLIDGNKRRPIDSATVSQNRFTLSGSPAEPAHIYLHAGRGPGAKKLADILLDNRTVHVGGNGPEYDSVRARRSTSTGRT